MAGSSKSLVKTFNKLDVPVTLLIIFCSGGIDFVGGYSYYSLIKQDLLPHAEGSALIDASQKQLGKLKLDVEDGEAIHDKLFVSN